MALRVAWGAASGSGWPGVAHGPHCWPDGRSDSRPPPRRPAGDRGDSLRRHEPESCQSAIAEAAERLGGIDALVYTPAIGPLASLVDTDAETWRRVFDTNVIGAALVTTAAVPHLTASSGTPSTSRR